MNIRRILLIIAILIIHLKSAGQSNVSSLKELSPNAYAKDTILVRSLIATGTRVFINYPDSALALYQRAAAASQRAGLYKELARSWAFISSCYYNKNEIDSCLLYCQQVLELPSKKILPVDLSLVYNNMGKVYRRKTLYQKGTYYTQKAITLIKQQAEPDKNMLLNAYTELGAQHGSIGDYEKAITYFDLAEQEAINDTPKLAVVVANKALLYHRMAQKEKAFHYATKAYQLGRTCGDLMSQIRGASTLASLYAENGNNEKAMYYANITQSIANRQEGNIPEYLTIYFTLSNVYFHNKDYKNAELTLATALKLAESEKEMDGRIPGGHQRLAAMLARRGAYKEAYEHQKITQETFGRFLSEEDARKSKELEFQHKTLEKDRDLAWKQLQIGKQESKLKEKNLWIAGTSIAVIMVGLVLFYSFRISRRKRREQAAQIRILEQQQALHQQETEINRLKDMMQGEEKERIRIARELHDGIVSQLMALRLHFKGILQNREDQEAFAPTLQYLDEATKELRKTAHNLMPETVLQGGLIVALDSYCQKMETASATPIYFQHFGTIGERQPDVELSLYRIVQELIQNALKHAVASHILVELHLEGNYLSLTVEDDGRGFVSSEPRAEGMGLGNIRARLKTLQGEMDLRSTPGKGTAVHLEFNLKQTL